MNSKKIKRTIITWKYFFLYWFCLSALIVSKWCKVKKNLNLNEASIAGEYWKTVWLQKAAGLQLSKAVNCKYSVQEWRWYTFNYFKLSELNGLCCKKTSKSVYFNSRQKRESWILKGNLTEQRNVFHV
jgi:hypothetical protein